MDVSITVKLYGALRQFRPQDLPGQAHHPFEVVIPAGSTIATIAQQLKLPDGLVNTVAHNGESVDLATSLVDGDKVYFFPPVSGG